MKQYSCDAVGILDSYLRMADAAVFERTFPIACYIRSKLLIEITLIFSEAISIDRFSAAVIMHVSLIPSSLSAAQSASTSRAKVLSSPTDRIVI